MPPSVSSKVSFINWVLGGPLVTISKTEDPQPRQSRAHRVVITELDSVCPIPLSFAPNIALGSLLCKRVTDKLTRVGW